MAKLVFLGRLGDLQQDREVELPSHVADTDALLAWLGADDAEFAAQIGKPGHAVVVNHELVHTAQAITNADEIAFLSPVSGG